jgi:DNA-directed RNA polymerase specialized sigma24 family protein
MADDDVTRWIGELAEGDQQSAERLWNRYRERLAVLARKRLGERHRRAADEEDVVLSAFDTFCRGMAAGRFPMLKDRDDLWRLLVTITARKAVSRLRREHAEKRGGGQVRGDSICGGAGFEEVLGREPTPELAAQVVDQCDHLMDLLDDPSLRLMARLKLEGYTNEEISRSLDCAVGTVERKLARIRHKWSKEIEQ